MAKNDFRSMLMSGFAVPSTETQEEKPADSKKAVKNPAAESVKEESTEKSPKIPDKPVEVEKKAVLANKEEPAKDNASTKKRSFDPQKLVEEKTEKIAYVNSSLLLSRANANFIRYMTGNTGTTRKEFFTKYLEDKLSEMDLPEDFVPDFDSYAGKPKYHKENSTQLSIMIPKDLNERIRRLALIKGVTISSFIDEMITEDREAFLADHPVTE